MFYKLLCVWALFTVLELVTEVKCDDIERYVILNNSNYGPYETLFKKRPSLRFNDTYDNQFMRHVDEIIHPNKIKDIRVCFLNHVEIDDQSLKANEGKFKDSRKIAEYNLSKISKYTALKFLLANRKCHIRINFDKRLDSDTLGLTSFYVAGGLPRAEVEINLPRIKTYVSEFNLSMLRTYMQVLMHEMLHALGIDHSSDDTNARSIISTAYDLTNQQLLYKKDVYSLRAIYGVRMDNLTRNTIMARYSDPSDWDQVLTHAGTTMPTDSTIESQNETSHVTNGTQTLGQTLLGLQKESSRIKYSGIND